MPSPNRDIQITGLMSFTFSNSVTGASGGGNLGTYLVFRDRESTESVRTPNFKRIRRSLLPTNPYHHYVQRITDPRSTFTTDKVLSNGSVDRHVYSMNGAAFGCSANVPVGWAADDPTQRVVNKILEQISLGKGNLAVTMAEMDKTAQHVAHTATRIFNAVKALKHGRFGDFTKALGVTTTRSQTRRFYTGLKTSAASDGITNQKFKWKKGFKIRDTRNESRVSDFLSDTWLEYSYGWKPLLKDVYDLAAAAAESFIEHSNHVRSARARTKTYATFKDSYRPDGNQVVYKRECRDEIWYEMEVRYRIPLSQFQPAYAFGLTNPLEVAWELVPFSFVVDWFLPVGDAIRALSGFNGLEFAGGYDAYKHERTYTHEVLGAGESVIGGVTWRNQSGGGKLTNWDYEQARRLLPSFPSYGWPKFKDPRSFAHAASAIALLQSLFLRGGR